MTGLISGNFSVDHQFCMHQRIKNECVRMTNVRFFAKKWGEMYHFPVQKHSFQ